MQARRTVRETTGSSVGWSAIVVVFSATARAMPARLMSMSMPVAGDGGVAGGSLRGRRPSCRNRWAGHRQRCTARRGSSAQPLWCHKGCGFPAPRRARDGTRRAIQRGKSDRPGSVTTHSRSRHRQASKKRGEPGPLTNNDADIRREPTNDAGRPCQRCTDPPALHDLGGGGRLRHPSTDLNVSQSMILRWCALRPAPASSRPQPRPGRPARGPPPHPVPLDSATSPAPRQWPTCDPFATRTSPPTVARP